MLKLFSICFFLLIPLAAQTADELSQALLEEHGSNIQVLQDYTPYSPDDSSTWTLLPECPSNFCRSVTGAIGDYIYVFAGQAVNSLAVAYHKPTNTWVNSTPCLGPGYNAGFCTANGEIYKLSGTSSTSVFEKFTPDGAGTGTWTPLTPGPSTIMNAQNSLVWGGGNYIYAYSSGISSPYPSYFYRYSISGGTWEQMASSIYPRRYAGMTRVGDYIYLIGGLLSDGTSAAICQKYDMNTNTWSQIADLPEPVNFTKWTVDTDGRYVFLIGSGGGYSSYPLSSNCYYYHPGANTWTLESMLPAPRGLAHANFFPGYSEFFWGGGNDGSAGTAFQNDVWKGTGGIYIPVELTSFTAQYSGESVVLNWTTATETNNSYFSVERSSDNINFTEEGRINGSGTKNTPTSYSFTDQSLPAGQYFYRLKQVDYNGEYEYSSVINITTSDVADYSLGQNYPNPFNPSTTINYSVAEKCNVRIEVFDVTGNSIAVLVNEIKSPGRHSVNYISSAPSGVYFYKISAGSFAETKKLILLR